MKLCYLVLCCCLPFAVQAQGLYPEYGEVSLSGGLSFNKPILSSGDMNSGAIASFRYLRHFGGVAAGVGYEQAHIEAGSMSMFENKVNVNMSPLRTISMSLSTKVHGLSGYLYYGGSLGYSWGQAAKNGAKNAVKGLSLGGNFGYALRVAPWLSLTGEVSPRANILGFKSDSMVGDERVQEDEKMMVLSVPLQLGIRVRVR
ncbi:MAG: hypothetical protein EOP49_07900 [Sphingobacteriales bacterium]|nr:MAG: hypothetical protein EOP49_07900 [Sphingobacteriales bacterium]